MGANQVFSSFILDLFEMLKSPIRVRGRAAPRQSGITKITLRGAQNYYIIYNYYIL